MRIARSQTQMSISNERFYIQSIAELPSGDNDYNRPRVSIRPKFGKGLSDYFCSDVLHPPLYKENVDSYEDSDQSFLIRDDMDFLLYESDCCLISDNSSDKGSRFDLFNSHPSHFCSMDCDELSLQSFHEFREVIPKFTTRRMMTVEADSIYSHEIEYLDISSLSKRKTEIKNQKSLYLPSLTVS
jgi:hypothetical protein